MVLKSHGGCSLATFPTQKMLRGIAEQPFLGFPAPSRGRQRAWALLHRTPPVRNPEVLQCAFRGVIIKLHLAAREGVSIDTAEDEVGIRHGGFDTTAAVAGWPGHGSSRSRPNPESASLHPGNGATAGTDGVDIDHAHEHG